MQSSTYGLILPAAGKGLRMKQIQAKQFSLINQKPVIVHTIEKFLSAFSSIQIVVAINEQAYNRVEQLIVQYPFLQKIQFVEGGNTRYESVKKALAFLSCDFIAVHDAVRPLVSEELIKQCFKEAQEYGNAIPALPLSESLRKYENDHSKALDRDLYRIVQTPQVFASNQIKTAYLQSFSAIFTDDASLVERAGFKIHLIPGEHNNIKLTYPIDFKLASLLIDK